MVKKGRMYAESVAYNSYGMPHIKLRYYILKSGKVVFLHGVSALPYGWSWKR